MPLLYHHLILLLLIYLFSLFLFTQLSVAIVTVSATDSASNVVDKIGHHAINITLGGYATCIRYTSGKSRCFGMNLYGGLAIGDKVNRGDTPNTMGYRLPFVYLFDENFFNNNNDQQNQNNITESKEIIDISYGGFHACAVIRYIRKRTATVNGGGDTDSIGIETEIDRNELKCFGENTFGKLGYGDLQHRGFNISQLGDNLPAVDLNGDEPMSSLGLALGDSQTCVLTKNNKVRCFGNGFYGALGYEDSSSRGFAPNQMGVNLPYVNLGIIKPIAIFSGSFAAHNCVIFENRGVKCWGSNFYGQLGYSNKLNYGDKSGQMGDNLPFLDFGENSYASMVALNNDHTCVLLQQTHAIKCWGNNINGQLGYGDNLSRGSSLLYPLKNLIPIDHGAPSGVIPIYITTGAFHTCALFSTGGVKCWGNGSNGSLGYEKKADIGSSDTHMGPNLPFVNLGTGVVVSKLATGSFHNCVILSDGKIKCWGLNSNGQLGLGDTRNRGIAQLEMGDNLPYVDVSDTYPSVSPTNSPTTSHPTLKPTSVPTFTPTSSPTTFAEGNAVGYYFLITGVPIAVLALISFIIGDSWNQRKLIMAVGLALLDAISDLIYVIKGKWFNWVLHGLSIAVLVAPSFAFVWAMLRFSRIRPLRLSNHAPKQADDICTAIAVFVAFIVDETALLILSIFLSILFFPVVCILIVFKLIVLSRSRNWVLRVIAYGERLWGFDDERIFVAEDEAYIINVAVLSDVFFESAPQLAIVLANHFLGKTKITDIFVLCITMSSLSILNSLYPIIFMFCIAKSFSAALRTDRYSVIKTAKRRSRESLLELTKEENGNAKEAKASLYKDKLDEDDDKNENKKVNGSKSFIINDDTVEAVNKRDNDSGVDINNANNNDNPQDEELAIKDEDNNKNDGEIALV